MQDLLNPLPWLADLAEFFGEGVAAGGLTIDAELCRSFGDSIREIAGTMQALLTLADEYGLVERVTLPYPPPRTPTARRLLAALAQPLDPEGRVVAFPVAPTRPVPVAEGGSAA